MNLSGSESVSDESGGCGMGGCVWGVSLCGGVSDWRSDGRSDWGWVREWDDDRDGCEGGYVRLSDGSVMCGEVSDQTMGQSRFVPSFGKSQFVTEQGGESDGREGSVSGVGSVKGWEYP